MYIENVRGSYLKSAKRNSKFTIHCTGWLNVREQTVLAQFKASKTVLHYIVQQCVTLRAF